MLIEKNVVEMASVGVVNGVGNEDLVLVPARRKNKKYTYEEVKEIVDRKGYQLISDEYINNTQKLKLMCNNNHEIEASFSYFMMSVFKCNKCFVNKYAKPLYEEVKAHIEGEGFKLLSDTYIDSTTKLLLQCPNFHNINMSFSSFKNQGHRCGKCSGIAKLTYEEVKSYIENEGYKLISDSYNGNKSVLEMLCPNSHKFETTFNQFSSDGTRCKLCSNSWKYTYEEVKKYIEDEGFTLISDNYINCSNDLILMCPKGHQRNVTFASFKSGNRCAKCSNHVKFTYEEVKEYIEKEGYTLLSNEYIDSSHKLSIKCPTGHERMMTFSSFKCGNRCAKCSNHCKFTYEEVKSDFESRGFRLISTEYINITTNLNYICPAGHEITNTYDNFKTSSGCSECSGRKKYTYEYVKNYFTENGCTLLENEYISNSYLMRYICNCGVEARISFNNFKSNCRCMACGLQKMRHSFEDVKKLFEDNGCKLLENEYKNAQTLMKYICSCGNEAYICYTNFRRGVRCNSCKQDRVKAILLQKYGYEHVSQVPAFQAKMESSRKLWKEYTLPSGNVIKYQGYENMAFDDLFKKLDYKEEDVDIHCRELTNQDFWYYFDGMYRHYFPDIYLKDTNTIIEVKSPYIFNKEFKQNLEKAKCCIALGYDFEFWIYDDKGNKEIIKYNKSFGIDL